MSLARRQRQMVVRGLGAWRCRHQGHGAAATGLEIGGAAQGGPGLDRIDADLLGLRARFDEDRRLYLGGNFLSVNRPGGLDPGDSRLLPILWTVLPISLPAHTGARWTPQIPAADRKPCSSEAVGGLGTVVHRTLALPGGRMCMPRRPRLNSSVRGWTAKCWRSYSRPGRYPLCARRGCPYGCQRRWPARDQE